MSSKLCILHGGDVTLKGEERYWFLGAKKEQKSFFMDLKNLYVVVLKLYNRGWRGSGISRKENVPKGRAVRNSGLSSPWGSKAEYPRMWVTQTEASLNKCP